MIQDPQDPAVIFSDKIQDPRDLEKLWGQDPESTGSFDKIPAQDPSRSQILDPADLDLGYSLDLGTCLERSLDRIGPLIIEQNLPPRSGDPWGLSRVPAHSTH